LKLYKKNTYSHFLFMDDDIELDSESIYRLFSLYEYAKDFAVAGSMLDLYKRMYCIKQEHCIVKDPKTTGFAPFSIVPLKQNVDLQNISSLNLLLRTHIDYGVLVFFL